MKRYIKYIPIVLLLLSCTKESAPGNGGATSYDEHNWEWNDSSKLR